MHEIDSIASSRVPSLYLDYGADAQACDEAIEVSERGMRFQSRWKFEIGTQMAIACVHEHPRLGRQRVTVEGIVVWCQPGGSDHCYETTLLFPELPDELRQSLREFSHQLAAAL